MGAFDPDAYLAKPVSFDPDAYLAKGSKEVPSTTPTYADAIPAAREPDRGMLDYLAGIPETAVTLGAGAVRGAIAPFAAVAGELIGGVNTPEGRAQGARWGGNVEKALTYTPQTQTAKDIIGYAGEKLQNVDFNAIPFAQGSVAAAMAPAATRQAASAIKNEAGYLKNAISEIPAVTKYAEDTAAANIKKSVENAGRVESAQFAPKYGILLNPEHSNPSTGANMRAGLIGDSDINAKMSAANEPKWNEAVKTGLNLPSNKKLTSEVFKEAHAAPELSKPYENARALPVVTADDSAVKSLSSLKLPELVSDVSGVSTKANKYLTELTKRLKKGTDGSNLLDSAIELRRDAQDILKADKITPLERKLAKMKQGAADIIETMINDNLPLSERDAFNKARVGHAQLYSAERATDLATGQINPSKLAKMISDKEPLTGTLFELGSLAANHPEVAQIGAKTGWTAPRITRATLSGAAGGAIGTMIAGPAGLLPGMAVGAGVGDIAKRFATKNMLSKGYQAKHAIPTDYRKINALAPKNRNNLRED